MATLNATTWTQAKTYVDNMLRTGDISGKGNVQVPLPTTADQFVPTAELLFAQISQKHGNRSEAYHNHTGTAGGLLALLHKMATSGNAALAKQLATSIHNNGSGVGTVMTSDGPAEFRGTSGCTRSDLGSFLAGRGVFQGVLAGRK